MAEEDTAGRTKDEEEVFAVFVTFEDTDTDGVVGGAAKETRKLARKAGCKRILINPFSHLSTHLAPADRALALSRLFTERLKESWEGAVFSAPFGWYKSFSLDIHGHDASQVYRSFS